MCRSFLKEKNFLRRILLKYIIYILTLILMIFLIGYRVSAETIQWQNFEYWDSPENHGWVPSNYPYPIWGPGVGYGTMRTIIDYTKGSRVLEIWNQSSVFNQLKRFYIRNSSSSLQKITAPTISFDIAGRFGLEPFDRFEFQVWLTTRNDESIVLRYIPIGESYQLNYSSSSITRQEENKPSSLVSGGDAEAGIPPEYNYTVIELGRQYQDGTWHKVIRDMDRDIDLADDGDRNYSDGFGEVEENGTLHEEGDSKIRMIGIMGNRYKLDDIFFHQDLSTFTNHPPKLYRIGPIFAQIFKPLILDIEASDIDYLRTNDYPEGREPSLHPERHQKTADTPLLYFEAYIGGRGSRGSSAPNLITRVDMENKPCSLNDEDINPFAVQLVYNPQVLENLIITICVYDERGLSDMEVFPLTTVNYPIPNYPPQLEELEDDVYILGDDDPYFKQIRVRDYTDEGKTAYFAYIDKLPYYSYGPYQEDLIPDPTYPVITFTPQFEGVHRITVVARDTRGLTAVDEYTLVVANPGGWYNHPPILGENIDSPQFTRAGQMFSIPIEFFDPDLEPIYYSCNIGTVSHLMAEGIETHTGGVITAWGESYDSGSGMYRGGAVYFFMTHFPGIYHIEITAYDVRGGKNSARFILDVQPWWSL